MITTLLSFLLGCVESRPSYQPTLRDWELYAPGFDRELHLPTTVKWSADPLLVPDLKLAANEWRSHTSCGITFQQVPVGDETDVTFTCEAFPVEPNAEARALRLNDQGHVTIDPAACTRGGLALGRHAMGHALGFKHEEKWFETRMSSVALVLEQMHGVQPRYDLDPMEIDGLRYWALSNGAPGCEGDELDWSWNSHPELYNPDTLNNIISELDQGIINR